jgi:hypothetical protein
LVVRNADAKKSAILVVQPGLERELDAVAVSDVEPALREFVDENGVRVFDLRRNGKVVGRTWERTLEGGRVLVLLLAPPAMWDTAPSLYRALIRDAHAADGPT